MAKFKIKIDTFSAQRSELSNCGNKIEKITNGGGSFGNSKTASSMNKIVDKTNIIMTKLKTEVGKMSSELQDVESRAEQADAKATKTVGDK